MVETTNIEEIDLKTSIDTMITRLQTIHWGKNAGVQMGEADEKVNCFMDLLNVSSYSIKWLSKAELPETISRLTFEGSELWNVLKEIPERLSQKIRQAGQEKWLFELGDYIPELIFHPSYSHMVELATDKKSIEYLVGVAMYLSVMACTAELAGEGNIFLPIIELLEMGNLPLGLEGNAIYLL